MYEYQQPRPQTFPATNTLNKPRPTTHTTKSSGHQRLASRPDSTVAAKASPRRDIDNEENKKNRSRGHAFNNASRLASRFEWRKGARGIGRGGGARGAGRTDAQTSSNGRDRINETTERFGRFGRYHVDPQKRLTSYFGGDGDGVGSSTVDVCPLRPQLLNSYPGSMTNVDSFQLLASLRCSLPQGHPKRGQVDQSPARAFRERLHHAKDRHAHAPAHDQHNSERTKHRGAQPRDMVVQHAHGRAPRPGGGTISLDSPAFLANARSCYSVCDAPLSPCAQAPSHWPKLSFGSVYLVEVVKTFHRRSILKTIWEDAGMMAKFGSGDTMVQPRGQLSTYPQTSGTSGGATLAPTAIRLTQVSN